MINIFEPSIQDQTLNLIDEVFKSKWLGRGKLVDEFERNLRDYLGIENVSTISCASDAIFGALKIFNFKKNSKIALPVNSFPAVGSAIISNSLIPVFIDIDKNGNIDLSDLIKKKNENLSAIFITHYGGNPVDVKKIKEEFDEIIVLEDSACALGSSKNNIKIGTDADFSCWSFDAMKLITCGEGGAFSFKNTQLFVKAKEYFYLGLPSSEKSGLDKSKEGDIWWNYEINQPGVRSVFTNINAAIGLPNIQLIHQKLDHLKSLRSRYELNLNGKINYVEQNRSYIDYSNYFFTIFSKNRNDLAINLLKDEIYTTLRYFRLDEMNIFKKYNKSSFSGADKFYESALNIPIHSNLSLKDIDYISNRIIYHESILGA